jgi:DNA-binding NarL/FixJ family response regulator
MTNSLDKEINLLVEERAEEGKAEIHLEVDLELLPHYLKRLKTLFNEQGFVHKNYQKYMSLTSREKQVLDLIVKGHSNLNIAEKLNISFDTVRTHRKNLLRKLECKTMAQLVKYTVF